MDKGILKDKINNDIKYVSINSNITKDFVYFTANKAKLYYGLLKEPELNVTLEDEDEGQDAEEKPKVGHPILSNSGT